jgi:hypothetical protein
MPGLVPGIHAVRAVVVVERKVAPVRPRVNLQRRNDVDGRDKPGHDVSWPGKV